MRSLEERFWIKVEKTDNCWNWIGYKNPKGYGSIKIDGKKIRAHRLSYIIHFGKIPDGKIVMHACDNRRCVRPDHILAGTVQENNIDMMRKGRWKRISPSWRKGLRGSILKNKSYSQAV